MSKCRSPSKTTPASRPPMAAPITSCTVGQAQAAARDFRLVGRDLQHRQTGDLLDLDVGGARDAAQDAGDLVGCLQQRLELVAEHLDRDVAAHAREQFVEAHLDRLREFIGIAGQHLHGALDLAPPARPWASAGPATPPAASG